MELSPFTNTHTGEMDTDGVTTENRPRLLLEPQLHTHYYGLQRRQSRD